MKLARIVFVAVFLLSAVTTTAGISAQTVGFVPLLTRVHPKTPIQMQAQDALNSLMPRLLAAQKRGDILRFSPSLASGVLRIVYRPTADTSFLFAGRPVFSDMKHAAGSMQLPPPAARHAAASSPGSEATVAFELYIFDNWIYAWNLPAGAHVIGSLRDKTGRIISVTDGFADGTGFLSDYFTWNGSYGDVVPGFRAVFKVYNGAVLFGTYQAVAPSIRFTGMDKASSILNAAGPASKPYGAWWYHRLWNSSNGYQQVTKNGTTSAAGTWAVDFGAIPFRGHDSLETWVQTSSNFIFDRYMTVPYIYCEIGYNWCSIYGFASTPAALKIVHAGTAYNFTGKFSAWGYFAAGLENALGEPIFLVPGDSASGTGVASFPLPNLTAGVNYTTNVVYGKAPANKYFNVWTYVLDTGTWEMLYTHSDSLGNYSSNFNGIVDLKPTQPFVAEIYYVNPVTGNTVDFYRSFGP